MNIVLIGMRGSGKSTVAKLLSKTLLWKIAETDKMIEDLTGKSVSKIVKTSGWKEFRRIESSVVNEVSNLDSAIISTGGGVILNKNNINVLKKNGKLFWLKALPETLISRVSIVRNRPLLTGAKTIAADIQIVYKERLKLYKMAADYIIDTESKTAEEVAKDIDILVNFKGSYL